MKKFLASIMVFAAMATAASAQNNARPAPRMFGPRIDTVKIWPNGAPNSFNIPEEAANRSRRMGTGDIYAEAIMEVYPARNPNGTCIIMCPGGAYAFESEDSEGRDMKDWFNARGITYCVLLYRLPYGHHDVPSSDAAQAIRIMRGRKDLGITKVGIMGCSAGGHLASTVATHYTDAASRPDFQILLYPVITMDASFTHSGSRENLLGQNPSQQLVDQYSNEKHVTPDTPEAFIVLSSNDRTVPVANSLRYYEALVANKVVATMHIYPEGDHGWGWGDRFVYKNEWTSELASWLDNQVE